MAWTAEQAAAWLAEACFRVNVLAYGLPTVSDSSGAGIGAGTRRLLFYGPSAMPGGVGPLSDWEALLAAANAPALPLPPDWERASRPIGAQLSGDEVGDLTASTPPGPPSPSGQSIAPRRTMDELRAMGLAQAQAFLVWLQNPPGGTQAAVTSIVQTFGNIVQTVNNRLATLAASAAAQASSITTELRQWLHTWAVGCTVLYNDAVQALRDFATGGGIGAGLGLVLVLGLAAYLMTRKG